MPLAQEEGEVDLLSVGAVEAHLERQLTQWEPAQVAGPVDPEMGEIMIETSQMRVGVLANSSRGWVVPSRDGSPNATKIIFFLRTR